MNAARKDEGNVIDRRDWYRYWPLILTLAALIGWGYVTAYRVNASEEMIQKNKLSIESIHTALSEINIKLGILIDREERQEKLK